MTKAFAPVRYRRADERGLFVEVVTEGTWETVIHGKMHAGAVLGHHYHLITRIYFYLTAGQAEITIVDIKDASRRFVTLTDGEGTYLEPGEAHAVRFVKPSEFIMTKSIRHDPVEPDTYPYEIDLD